MTRRWAKAAGAVVLAGLTAVVYWPALQGGWLWDDDLELTKNPVLRDPHGWWRVWIQPVGTDYFPLKSLLQWCEWQVWGARPAAYHATNLVLHFAGALLLWRVLGRLARKPGIGPWLGAAVFAVHPMAVESVAWIAEFKNVLAFPLLLLAADAWLRGQEQHPAAPASGALAWFTASMLAKTTGALFPIALLLETWWRRGRVGWRDLVRTAPFFAVSAILGAVTWWVQRHLAMAPGAPLPPLPARVAEAGWSAWMYLFGAVVPFWLSPEYLRAAPTAPVAVLCWVALIGAGALLYRFRRRPAAVALSFGLGWFYLHLALVLGVAPMAFLRIAPRADHLAYLSLAGFAGLAGMTLAVWGRRPGGRLPAAVIAVALVGSFAIAARSRAAAYASSERLWSLALRRSPGAWLAANNLARERLRQGRVAEAIPLFETAVRNGPPSAEVLTNLGSALERTGRITEAQCAYEHAVAIDAGFAGAHYNLGHLSLVQGDAGGAEKEFRLALRSNPGSAAAHNDLGVALARQGLLAAALAEYETALRLDPGSADAWVNLGNARARDGEVEPALAAYRHALALDPANAAARRNLAAVSAWAARTAPP